MISLVKEPDDFNIEYYFASIEKRIEHQKGWKIDRDAIELGFFSFGKSMIYHDLDSAKWPVNVKPYEHPIVVV